MLFSIRLLCFTDNTTQQKKLIVRDNIETEHDQKQKRKGSYEFVCLIIGWTKTTGRKTTATGISV